MVGRLEARWFGDDFRAALDRIWWQCDLIFEEICEVEFATVNDGVLVEFILLGAPVG